MSRQLFEYHATTGYRFIPGLRARVPHESGGYLVRVNESGFRCDHPFQTAKTAGKRRILLFGDSFTAGDGVSNGQRFGDQLEGLIPNLEVLNFGLPGTGTDQHYLAYREFGRSLDHDLLIIAVQVENVRRVGQRFRPFENENGEVRYFAKPYFEIVDGRLEARHVPPDPKPHLPEEIPAEFREDTGGRFGALRRLVNTIGMKELAQKVTRFQPVPEYDDPANASWLLMKRVLEEWISGHDRPVLLMPVPLYHHIEETSSADAYRQRFQEIVRSTGCLFHDPLPDLLGYSPDERRRFRFAKDLHPTQAGHAALARSLAVAVTGVLR